MGLFESITENTFASGDNEFDEQMVQSIFKDSEWNEWAWCNVRVMGTYRGLSCSDYLGGCSYKSGLDFIQNSGYYNDMQESVHTQIIQKLEALK